MLKISFILVAMVGAGNCGDDQRLRNDREPVDFNRRELSISVTGQDFQWEITYPGRDGELGTDDDLKSRRDLDVPAGATVTLLLTSKDYVYMFELPEFGVKEVAVPELEFSATLRPLEPDTYELLGNQMCGYEHPTLLGTLFVRTPPEFSERMRSLETRKAGKS